MMYTYSSGIGVISPYKVHASAYSQQEVSTIPAKKSGSSAGIDNL